ncbi:MAG: FAD:protein FMN transferase, partial [Marinirhabdus sp.]|nr:FAD:protein FMN transferase [Marinirhabdus sp.]
MRYIALFVFAFVLFSCEDRPPEPQILQGEAFGTTYAVTFYAYDDFEAKKGLDSVFQIINKSVSTYMPQSDISRINQGDSSVVTDRIFKEVFQISQDVFKQSNGHFDPTVGILRNAYGFGDADPVMEMDSIVLDSLKRYVGFDKVRLNEDGTVHKMYPEIYLDFNAVAKGYGIDRVGA